MRALFHGYLSVSLPTVVNTDERNYKNVVQEKKTRIN